MIEGFTIEVPAEEIMRRLDERIEYHHELADECDRKRIRLEATGSLDQDDEDYEIAGAWPAYPEHLQRSAERHRQREAVLVFIRERVIPSEVYRLGERDLRWLQLLPDSRAIRRGALEL